MAQLNRSAKSDSNWTYNELYAYNITITATSPINFFQLGADPSLDHLDPSILTSPASDADDPNLSEGTSESAINDFAAATLGFRAPNTTVATRYAIPLIICGEKRATRADVCVIHGPTTILLVLAQDKAIFKRAENG